MLSECDLLVTFHWRWVYIWELRRVNENYLDLQETFINVLMGKVLYLKKQETICAKIVCTFKSGLEIIKIISTSYDKYNIREFESKKNLYFSAFLAF